MKLSVYIDDETKRRLEDAADDYGWSLEQLAESAISEAALEWFRRKQFARAIVRPTPKEPGHE